MNARHIKIAGILLLREAKLENLLLYFAIFDSIQFVCSLLAQTKHRN